MTHASDHSTHPARRRFPDESPDPPDPSSVEGLSDRQAVVAMMVAGGRTCQDIASDLLLPLRTVQGHLHRALEILGLSSAEDLTYAAVASHSSTSPLTAPTPLGLVALRVPHGAGRNAESNVVASSGTATRPQTVSRLDSFVTGSLSSSLAVLDAAEAEQGAEQEPDEIAALRRELAATRALLEQRIEKVQQLQQAVVSRDVIGQAKGILMERHKISADRAFAILQRESSHTNRKLAHVAEQLVYSGGQDDHRGSRPRPDPRSHTRDTRS